LLLLRNINPTSKNSKLESEEGCFDEKASLSSSEASRSSQSSCQYYEGGNSSNGDDGKRSMGNTYGNSVIQEEDEEDTGMDPDDPYQINRLNEISHE